MIASCVDELITQTDDLKRRLVGGGALQPRRRPSITEAMQTTSERALSELLPLIGRRLSIEIAAPDGWTIASFSGLLEHVEAVAMRGGAGGST